MIQTLTLEEDANGLVFEYESFGLESGLSPSEVANGIQDAEEGLSILASDNGDLELTVQTLGDLQAALEDISDELNSRL